MIKRVLIYCFSGTYNTFLAATYIAKYFKLNDIEVDVVLYNTKKMDDKDPNDYDLIGIGYPIHAFNVPQAFYHFIKALPKVNNKKYFIFKTSGEPFKVNSASSYRIYKSLKKKGYKLVMEKHLLMPYNIMFRYKNEVVKQQYLYLEPLCNVMVIRLLNDEVDNIKFYLIFKLVSFVFRIEYLAPKLNHYFCRINKVECNKCLVCVNNCPTGTIYLDENNNIKFSNKCALCMRCTMYCPKNAIKFGFMNSWKVNPKYDFKQIENDFTIEDHYIQKNIRSYFRLFYKYYKSQDELLEKYNVELKR